MTIPLNEHSDINTTMDYISVAALHLEGSGHGVRAEKGLEVFAPSVEWVETDTPHAC